MPVPTINPLPQAPSRSDGPVAFSALADPFIAALPPFVLQANALALAINNALISIASSVDAAAGSASAAATSANAANSSKNAAAQSAIDATNNGAAQVALAAQQVALANAAKIEAQSAAVASGAGAGFPVGREPFTALQINKAGAVSWGPSLPDRATAQAGQSLMLDGDNLPKWAFAGQQIGDLLTTARNLPTDFSSVQATLPASVTWASVTYGKGLFVAVATSSNIAATSPDGINWTQRTLPASATWYAVTYGNGIFVAVGGGMTVIATSPDGITWTQRSAPLSATWRGVTYGGGLFVAVGISSAIAITSPDGITWTQRVLPASINWYSISYGNGIFVATASSGSVCATSPDGITWTGRILPASYNLRGIAFGNGLFVAVATSSAIAITSPDGINWTQRTLPASATWAAVTYGNGIFVAVANASANAATSPDGITWTQRALAVSTTWVAVAYGGGIYATIASNSTIAAKLVQGSGYLPANGTVYLQSAYPELFAKVGIIGGTIGTAWADYDYGGIATGNIEASLSGTIIVVQSNTQIRRSADRGQTWANITTPTLGANVADIKTDGRGTWLILSGATASPFQCLRSTDNGLTWQLVTLPATSNGAGGGWFKLCYCGAGVWIATANYSSTLIRSTDGGASWSTVAHGYPAGNMNAVGANGSGVVLISAYDGTNSTVRKSTDYGVSFSSFLTLTTQAMCISTDNLGTWLIGLGGVNALRSFDDAATSSGFASITVTGGTGIGNDIIFVNGLVFFMFNGSGSKVIIMNPNGTFSPQTSAANASGRFAHAGNGVIFAGSITANRLSRSTPVFGYDTATQFAVPNPLSIVGLTHYIKAREVA